MRRQTTLLTLFLLLQTVAPLLWWISPILGYEFLLFHEPLYLIVCTALTIAITIIVLQDAQFSRLSLLLLPTAALGGISALWFTHTLTAIFCTASCCICGGILFSRCAPGGIGRTACSVLSVLLLFCLAGSCLLDLFVESMSQITVVTSLASPDRAYIAVVTDHDHGATGGATTVDIYDNGRSLNLIFAALTPAPQEVYRGDWGEFQDMKLYWTDSDTLCINGFAHDLGHIGSH